MSKRKRGMTLEEKRQTLLGILMDSKVPYDLKEMESLGGKAGVVTQTVKEVMQSLVDDSLVELEKVGAKNFFWAFPSKALRQLQTRVEALEKENAAHRAAIAEAEARIATLSAGRVESEERKEKLARLAALREESRALEAEVETHKHNDPEVIKELARKVEVARAAANRWTDNTWALKDYLKKKLGRTAKEADLMLGINDDFDYVPDA